MLDTPISRALFLWRHNLFRTRVTRAHLKYLLVKLIPELFDLINGLSLCHDFIILGLFLIGHYIGHQLRYFAAR